VLHRRLKGIKVRNVVASEYVTLDGVFEEPAWSAPYWSDEAQHFQRDQLWASDALLLGRKTYEGFAQFWPTDEWIEREGEFAERMNSYPKYVASTSLEEPLEWNNSHLLGGDVAGAVRKLKQEEGKNILMYGSASLMRSLMAVDLIDRLLTLVHPLVLGEGKRLFREGKKKTELELVDVTTLENGIVVLDHKRADA
jgi:dihydrofolate reductase